MCDPVSVGVGLLGGMVASRAMAPKQPAAAAQTDPAAERTAAEQEATRRANAQIADAQRRRRSQRGLLALGVDDQSSLGQAGNRAGAAGQRALLGMGAAMGRSPAAAGAGIPGGFYGGGGVGASFSGEPLQDRTSRMVQ
jgi:hypothetical protein